MLSKILKIIKIIGLFAISTILILLIFMQTPLFKNWIKSVIENQVNSQINGVITIGKLQGNLITNLSLDDINITLKGDSLLFLQTLFLDYQPLKLLDNEISINTLRFSGLKLYLKKQGDENWNFSDLLKKGQTVSQESESGNISDPITINLTNCDFLNSNILLSNINKYTPGHLKLDTLRLEAYYHPDSFKINLRQMKLLATQPRIDIRNIKFILSKNETGYSLKNFSLKTSENYLNANARIKSNEILSGKLNLQMKDVHVSEFEMILPDLFFPLHPEINLESNFDQNSF